MDMWMAGDCQRMVVVVEEVDAARTALEWAVQNIVRSGDIITLLHVYQSSQAPARSSGQMQAKNSSLTRTSQRLLRLKGFHLALSFKDLCDQIPEAKVEIVVTEGDEGPTIVSLVKRLGASALILGLHNQNFLYRILGRKGTSDYCIKNLDCRVLAVKHKKSAKTGFPRRARMASEIRVQ